MSDETRGPVILREKPRDQLVDREAYAIPPEATREDFEGAAAWVKFNGGEIKVCDDEGLLVVSRYIDEDGYATGDSYHEWIGADSLIMLNASVHEFTVYGYSMGDHYLVEPMAGDLE